MAHHADEPAIPTATGWCLIDTTRLAGGDETGNWMQVTETVLLEGDARITRG